LLSIATLGAVCAPPVDTVDVVAADHGSPALSTITLTSKSFS
jgi:hypothetical protein